LNISIEPAAPVSTCLSQMDTTRICAAIYGVQNGVYRMSMAIPGLVETSSNLARVLVKDGTFTTLSLQRSSLETGKFDVAKTVAMPFALMGCQIEHSGSYPGWEPNPNSEILNVLEVKYKELFEEEPKVMAIHAGLECGLLGERYPGLDMISFGPTIKGAHSPDERVSISSVQKFWKFFLAVLADAPRV
jgi:dipeptidase D